MSSSPIRNGTPKAGPAQKSTQAGIPAGKPSPAGKGSSPAEAFKSRHKHLKYQLPEPQQEKTQHNGENSGRRLTANLPVQKRISYHIGFAGCLASLFGKFP
jgi:hypothetical protein